MDIFQLPNEKLRVGHQKVNEVIPALTLTVFIFPMNYRPLLVNVIIESNFNNASDFRSVPS